MPLAAPAAATSSARKIALFTNVEERAVISAVDVDDIYKIPMLLHEQGLDDIVVDKLRARRAARRSLRVAARWSHAKAQPRGRGHDRDGRQVRADLRDSYMSLTEALRHAGIRTRTRVNIQLRRVRRTSRQHGTACLERRRRDPRAGRLRRARHRGQDRGRADSRARSSVPYLGICLGMQVAVIEYARNVVGPAGRAFARSSTAQTPHPVIALITEWQDRDGTIKQRSATSELGGTMRLGAQDVLRRRRHAARSTIYGADEIHERHRHRYEFNNRYLRADARTPGCAFSGFSRDGLVEIIELPRRIRGSSPRSSTRSSRSNAARRPPAVHELHQRGARVPPGAEAAASARAQ